MLRLRPPRIKLNVHHKWMSTKANLNPQLRPDLFSKKLPAHLDISLTTYPNPLFGFSKNDLVSLHAKDLHHLLKIPYKTVSETDKFCFNVLEIIHENIVSAPNVAAKYLNAIKDGEMRSTILGCLRQYYKSDSLRRSLVMFIADPTLANTRKEILTTISRIICSSESSKLECVHMGLSYLHKLALTGTYNSYILFMPKQAHEIMMKHLPATQRAQFYACLLQINMKFQDPTEFEELKKSLLAGTNLERKVARTGFLDAKWQHVNFHDFSETQRQKMATFLTFNDLALYSERAIAQKDVVDANLYLDLLVTKFEMLGASSRRLQTVLNTMLHHSMVFKGPQECIKFLKYMKQSQLEIKILTLLKVLAQLIEDKCWDESLFLVNLLHTENLNLAQRSLLTRQIMRVITQKFSSHPQVALGYFALIFGGENDEMLHLLEDLKILELVYGENALLENIKRADIHEDLKGAELSLDTLREVYLVLLRNYARRSNVQLLELMFSRFLAQMEKAKSEENLQSIFHPENVDDSILSLFLDHLLRVDPYSTSDMDLLNDPARYFAAKEMFLQFSAVANLKREKRKVYVLDLLATSSLLYHRDIAFAAQLIKHARDCGMPLSFNQLYPFIMFHYTKGEHEQAKKWYDLLVQHGVRAKNVNFDKLVEIAKELGWEVKGTMYRTLGQQKNRKARQELAILTKDPLVALGTNRISQSEVESKPEIGKSEGDVNLLEELSRVLHADPQ